MNFVKDYVKIKYTNQLFHKNWSDFLKDVDRAECFINNTRITTDNLGDFINVLNEHHISNKNINTLLVLCSQSSLCLPFAIAQKNLLSNHYLSEIPENYANTHNIDRTMRYSIVINKDELTVKITKTLRIFILDEVTMTDKTTTLVDIQFECNLYRNSAFLKYKFINDISNK